MTESVFSKASSRMENDPSYNSLHEFFLNAANNIHTPDYPYLYRKEKGTWVSYTYRDVLEKVDAITAYFMSLGLAKGDRVSMILENCPEYYMIDQSLQKLGLVNVSIYPTLTAEETQFVLTNAGSKFLIVGNAFLLKKFKKIQDQCPDLLGCGSMVALAEDETDFFITFENLVKKGEELFPKYKEEIELRFKSVGKEDLSTLIYTSGTTGVPKGAMLTHYNFMSNCYDASELCTAINKDDLFMSFLPLSHVYERMATYYLGTYIGGQVAFAESIEKVAQNIGEMHPTIMACVPRLLEKVHDKVYANATGAGGMKAKIFLWAIGVGAKARIKIENGQSVGPFLSLKKSIAHKLVYSKIHARMGGRMRLFVSGGGALPKHVGEFFANLSLKVQEGFGLTETSPFMTVNEFDRQVYGTVGRVAPRQYVAIQNIESKEIVAVQSYDSFDPNFSSAEGEILAKGPNVMRGYWQNKIETDKVFDEEGWFHTGDIGCFEKGYLKITDRLKNMLVTSLGKNVYPTQLENNFLLSHKIEQIFIIGDKQEYISAIIVPNYEEAIKDLNLDQNYFEEGTEFIEDAKLIEWLAQDVKKLNENLAKFERVKEFLIKRRLFSIESGEMTPKLSVKRKVVMEKYANEIASMY